MLAEPSFNINGYSCIEGVVRTEDYVDLPAYRHLLANRAASFVNLLLDFLFFTAKASAFG